jgi:cytochrome c-type biogenesis protein CcmH
MEFLVSRYGDFVRYRPPVKGSTLMLWFGPFVLLIGGLVVLVRVVRRNQRRSAPPEMDAAQRAKAQSLLKDTETRS